MLYTKYVLAFLLSIYIFPLTAQTSMVGTWELVSQKMVNPDGTQEVYDRSSIKSYKVITPTHFMVIAEKPHKNGVRFNYATGGTYTLVGNKYIESLEIASREDYSTNLTNFIVRVEGNKLYQKGSVTTKKGEKYLFDEIWQKVDLSPQENKDVLGAHGIY
jgi:hypothetical protein